MEISWWTLAIQGVNFIVLVWLLQRFLYKPIRDVIDRRRRQSEEALGGAEKAKREAEAQRLRYEQAHAGLEVERQAMLKEARAAIDAEREKILAAAAEEARTRAQTTMATIEQERAAAMQSMRAGITDLAVGLARKLLADLAASVPSDAVLARVETELRDMPEPERHRLDAEIAANGAGVEVITAHALTPEEQRTWSARLQGALAHDLKMSFAEDPSLLAGAVIRLPHTAVRATWADQLERARAALAGGEGGERR